MAKASKRQRADAPRGPGRPPLDGDEAMMAPITLRLPKDMHDRLDAIRASRLDRPSKATLVRELIAKALSKA